MARGLGSILYHSAFIEHGTDPGNFGGVWHGTRICFVDGYVCHYGGTLFMVAAQALAECSPALSDPQGALLPPLEDIRGVSRRVALAVAAEAQRQGVAERAPAEASERLVDAKMWTPHYSRLRRRAG